MKKIRTEEEIISKWKVGINEPTVSICCLTYNHDKYIAETLDSFLMQETDFSFEIIINDDCSQDNTAMILKDYENRYPNIIKPIYQEANQLSQGVGPLSEFIFPIAKGQFIAICDGDDFWISSTKLKNQVNEFYKNDNLTLVHTDVGHLVSLFKNEDRLCLGINTQTKRMIICGDMKKESWLSCPIYTCSMMIKKNVIDEYLESGITDNLGMGSGDRAMYLFAAQRGEIGYLKEITSVYRENISSLTNSNKKNFIDFAITVNQLIDFSLDYFSANNDLRYRCSQLSKNRIFKAIIKFGSFKDIKRVGVADVLSRRKLLLLYVAKSIFIEKIYSNHLHYKRLLKIWFYYSKKINY